MSEVDPFAGSAGLPVISFASKDQYGNMTSKPVGTRIGGKVLKAPTSVQSRNFTTKLPETWPDGNPKTSVVLDLLVDGVEMSLWVKKPSALYKAFGEAKGDALIKPGDMVFVTLIGFGKPEADKAPAKLYKVDYTPLDEFAAAVSHGVAQQAPPPPTAASSAPAPPPPAPAPAPPTEPVLSNGFTASALRASGWSEAQIAALSAPAPAPAPPAPATAPAPPAPAQATAEVSDEDRKLLGLA